MNAFFVKQMQRNKYVGIIISLWKSYENRVVDQTFEEERALYNISDTQVKSRTFNVITTSIESIILIVSYHKYNFLSIYSKEKTPHFCDVVVVVQTHPSTFV